MKMLKRSALMLLTVVMVLALFGVRGTVGALETAAVSGDLAEIINKAQPGSTVQLTGDVVASINVSKDICLDLNGHSITGTVTVAKGNTLTVKDSSTDDFYSADGYGKIKATAGTGKVKASEGYIAVTEEDGLSYHRLDLQISSVNLRPGAAGMYFGSNYGGDEAVKSQIKTYGMVMSLAGAPTVQDIISDTAYSTHTAFSGDSWVCGETGKAYGTLLQNIMKPTNTTEQNTANAARYIYSVAYAELKDGSYILSTPVCISLQEVVESIDNTWNVLDASQISGMREMFLTYEEILESWNVPNLLTGICYQVTFVDHDGTVLDIQSVRPGKAASAPVAPTREGYIFTGWDKSFGCVASDLTITAQYIEKMTNTVTFYDSDGQTILKSTDVKRGENAVPPGDPSKAGYIFAGWDGDCTNIQKDTAVTAKYVPVSTRNIIKLDYVQNSNGTISVTVKLCGNLNVAAIEGTLEYNEEMFTCGTVSKPLDCEFDFAQVKYNTGSKTIRFAYACSEGNVTTDTVLFTANFSCSAEQAADMFTLKISDISNYDFETEACTILNRLIVVA